MPAILPNELLWKDGELWEWRNPSWKWIDDGSAQGLYCQQHDCRPYLFLFFEDQERRISRWLQEKKQESFSEQLAPGPTSITTIDAQISRRKREHRRPTWDWIPTITGEEHLPETHHLKWWQKVRAISVHKRAELELKSGRDDHIIADEIERGEWD